MFVWRHVILALTLCNCHIRCCESCTPSTDGSDRGLALSTSILYRLKAQGIWKAAGMCTLLDMSEELEQDVGADAEPIVIDLTEEDDVEGEKAQEVVTQKILGHNATGLWGIHASDVVQVILDELRLIKRELPTVWAEMLERGEIIIILSMDNTTRQMFDGRSCKVEQGVLKIFLPLVGTAQQSPYMAIPIFLLEGEKQCAASAMQGLCAHSAAGARLS